MLNITPAAKKALTDILVKRPEPNLLGLRLYVRGGVPGAYQSEFHLVRPEDDNPTDAVQDLGPFKVYVHEEHVPLLEGTTIDAIDTARGPQFKIDFPQPVWDDPLAAKVQKVISERVNPGLAGHGGYAALLGVENGIANIVMGGGCQGCGLSNATLKQGIEVMLKEAVPELKGVADQTDHAAGEKPYYQRGAQGSSAL